MDLKQTLLELRSKGYKTPTINMIKNNKQIEGIRKSSKINNAALDMVEENIKVGMSTAEIDYLSYRFITESGARPACLNYEGFPKSICISINNEVCHGIPSDRVILKEGDIVNVDITTDFNGYFSDASRMFIMGNASDEAKKLVRVTKECLDKALEVTKPFGFLGDIGFVIKEHAHNNGYTVVREFCGHGVGLAMHEDPCVMHVGKMNSGMILLPGMVFTIEPMINAGKRGIYVDRGNGWTARTRDGSLSAQWEHTILITEGGYEILSK